MAGVAVSDRSSARDSKYLIECKFKDPSSSCEYGEQRPLRMTAWVAALVG